MAIKKQVLFIHCGGSQRPQTGSSSLVKFLRVHLGSDYHIVFPEMPEPEQPAYDLWKQKLEQELLALEGEVLVVGHSLGASVVLKYFSEQRCPKAVNGLFLVAPPFWGADHWEVAEYEVTAESYRHLRSIERIFLYHSKNDEVVPFTHMGFYAGMLPHAVVRPLDTGGHLFGAGIYALVEDMKAGG